MNQSPTAPLRTSRTGVFLTLMLAFGILHPAGFAVNYKGSSYCPTKKCQDCEGNIVPETVEVGESCSSVGAFENNSVDIEFNLGTAGFKRPTGFAGMFIAGGQDGFHSGYPKDIREIKSFFYSSKQGARWRATVNLSTPVIDAETFKIASLDYNHALQMEVIHLNSYTPPGQPEVKIIRQIRTNEYLVGFEQLGGGGEGYTVKWWLEEDKGSKVNGYYQPVGEPVSTMTVSNPTPGVYGTLDVLTEGQRKIHHRYITTPASGGGSVNATHELQVWTDHPDSPNNPIMIGSDHIEYLEGAPVPNQYSGGGGSQFTLLEDQIRIRTIKRADLSPGATAGFPVYGDLKVIGRYREEFEHFGEEKRLTKIVQLEKEETENEENEEDGPAETYGYYSVSTLNSNPSDHPLHARKKWEKRPDGSWTIWDISVSPSVQTIKEITPFKDGTFVLADNGANVGDVIEAEAVVKTEVVTGGSMETTVKVLGTLVSRVTEEFITGPGGHEILVTKRYYGSGSAYLVSYEAFHPYGDGQAVEAGRIAWEVREDGTGCTYSYDRQTSGDIEVTVREGAAAGTGSAAAPTIGSGTETKTTYNSFWIATSEIAKDIASDEPLGMWFSPVQDILGRPTTIEFDGNGDDYETFAYTCCGPSEHRDRSGAVTTYEYDLLKRMYRSVTKRSSGGTEVETTIVHSGLTMTSHRNDGVTTLLVSSVTTSLDGLTTTTLAPDADGDTEPETTTRETVNLTNGSQTTVTYPDLSTAITTTYRDGQTKSRSGTAVTHMSYDYGSHSEQGGGRWTKTTAANGTEWTKSYSDRLNRAFKVEYPNGALATSTFYGSSAAAGSRGKLHTTTDPDENDTPGSGSLTVHAYNSEGELTTTTESLADSHSHTTVSGSDVIGSVTIHGTTIAPAISRSTTVNGVLVSTSYTSVDGRISATSTLSGDTLRIGTISLDVPVLDPVTSQPTGEVTNPGAWTVTSIGNDGLLSRAYYSDGLMKAAVVFEAGSTLPANAPGDITAVTDAGFVSGSSTTYNAFGWPETSTDSRTGTTNYDTYLENGALVSVTKIDSAQGNRTTGYTYDVMGRRRSVNLPDSLDSAGNPLTNVTHTTYTARGEVEATYGGQNYPIFRTYDAQGRMKTLRTNPDLSGGVPTDAGGSVTTWNYSSTRGWLTNKRDADGKGADYTYTPAGRLETRKWARAGTGGNRIQTNYGYDQGMLESVTYTNDPTNTPNLAYTYDNFGRINTVHRGGVLHADYDYDPVDLVLTVEKLNQDTLEPRTLERFHDPLLRPRSVEVSETGGASLHTYGYGYDPAGRLKEVWDQPSLDASGNPQGAADFTYAYQAGGYGLVQAVTGPVHTVTNIWETTRNVLDRKENKSGATNFSTYDYSVNAIGQRTGANAAGTAFSAPWGPWSVAWGYDALGQVVKEDHSATLNEKAYEFDAIGNRRKEVHGSLSLPGSDNYTANALNEYTATPYASVPLHDHDGNLTQGTVPGGNAHIHGGTHSLSATNLIWDAENRLVSITIGSATTSYEYDYLGRLIIAARNFQSEPEHYVYDGWNLVYLQYEVSSGIFCSFTWGLDLSGSLQGAGGVGGLLAVDLGGDLCYPLYDGNGNACQYLDGNGAYVARWEYDAFGRTTWQSTDIYSPWIMHRFSTKHFDYDTGLLYYGYRWYDPITGRWPSRDPIEEQGGMNLYGFVGNNGVNQGDFLGMVEITSELEVHPPPTYSSYSWQFYKFDDRGTSNLIRDIGPRIGTLAFEFYDVELLADAKCFCDGEQVASLNVKFWVDAVEVDIPLVAGGGTIISIVRLANTGRKGAGVALDGLVDQHDLEGIIQKTCEKGVRGSGFLDVDMSTFWDKITLEFTPVN